MSMSDVLEHVADVQRAGDVGRRDDQGEIAPGARDGMEDAAVDPPLCPMRLKPLRLVHFIDLHGKGEEKVLF